MHETGNKISINKLNNFGKLPILLKSMSEKRDGDDKEFEKLCILINEH